MYKCNTPLVLSLFALSVIVAYLTNIYAHIEPYMVSIYS